MAQLTGQEAIDYMRQHPGGFDVIDHGGMDLSQFMQPPQQQAQPQDQGNFLSDFFGSVAKPFVDAVKPLGFMGEAGLYALQHGNADANGVHADPNQFQSHILDQHTGNELVGNPLGYGARTAAGIGSFFVPGGGLGSAALGGALAGFGQTKDLNNPNEVLQNVLTGGALGGATHMALGGLGKLFNAGGNAGNALEDITTNKYVRFHPEDMTRNFADEAGNIINPQEARQDLFNKITTGMGNRQDIGNAVTDYFNSTKGELIDKLAANPATIDATKLASDAGNSIVKDIPGGAQLLDDPKLVHFINKIEDLGESAPVADIAKAKAELQQYLGSKTFSNVMQDKSITDLQQGLLKIEDHLNNAVANAAPETKPLLKDMSLIHGMKQDIARGLNKPQKALSLPLLGGVGDNGLKDTAMRKFAGVLKGGSGLSNIGSKITNVNNSTALPETLMSILGTQGGSGAQTPQGPSAGGNNVTSLSQAIGNNQGQDQNGNQAKVNQIMQAMIKDNPKITPTQIKENLSLMGINSKALGARQIGQLGTNSALLQQGQGLLNTINQKPQMFGPVAGGALGDIGQGIQNLAGGGQDRAQVQAQVQQVGGMLARSLGIPETSKSLPQLSDNPSIARAKIIQLYQELSQKNQALQDAYQQGGYNPNAGSTSQYGF